MQFWEVLYMFYSIIISAVQENKYFTQMHYVSWELWFYIPHLFFLIPASSWDQSFCACLWCKCPVAMTGILPAKVNSKWHSSHLGSSNAMWQLSEMTASIFELIGGSNCHWKEEISVLYMEKQLLFFPNGFSGMKAVQVMWIVTAIILREPISSYGETPPLFFFFFFSPFRGCP